MTITSQKFSMVELFALNMQMGAFVLFINIAK
jgi:hypothetical protein